MSEGTSRRRLRTGCLLLVLIGALVCGCATLTYAVFPPPPLDILVLGLDARPGESDVARADGLILVGVNPAGLQLSLLSIPRDLRLDLPGYGVQAINTAFPLGELEVPGTGSDLTAEGLEQVLPAAIDRTVRLRFEDFTALIDAAGGVTVNVERTIRDDAYPLSDTEVMSIQFDPGTQWMNGERALQYIRTRHADDDYARADRQQDVMQALARQIRNPLTWPSVIEALGQIETDLTLAELIGLAPVVLLNAGQFEQRTIDRSLLVPAGEGQWAVDWETLRPWVEAHFD